MAKKMNVDEIRARLDAIEVEVDEIGRAPVGSDEIEARVDQILGDLAAAVPGERFGSALMQPARKHRVNARGDIAESLLGSQDRLSPDRTHPMPAAAMLAALMPDAMRDWLLSLADDAAEGHPPALSAEERRQRLQLLAAERADLERQEVAECWRIEETGAPAPWRHDMRPELVLGLEA